MVFEMKLRTLPLLVSLAVIQILPSAQAVESGKQLEQMECEMSQRRRFGDTREREIPSYDCAAYLMVKRHQDINGKLQYQIPSREEYSAWLTAYTQVKNRRDFGPLKSRDYFSATQPRVAQEVKFEQSSSFIVNLNESVKKLNGEMIDSNISSAYSENPFLRRESTTPPPPSACSPSAREAAMSLKSGMLRDAALQKVDSDCAAEKESMAATKKKEALIKRLEADERLVTTEDFFYHQKDSRPLPADTSINNPEMQDILRERTLGALVTDKPAARMVGAPNAPITIRAFVDFGTLKSKKALFFVWPQVVAGKVKLLLSPTNVGTGYVSISEKVDIASGLSFNRRGAYYNAAFLAAPNATAYVHGFLYSVLTDANQKLGPAITYENWQQLEKNDRTVIRRNFYHLNQHVLETPSGTSAQVGYFFLNP